MKDIWWDCASLVPPNTDLKPSPPAPIPKGEGRYWKKMGKKTNLTRRDFVAAMTMAGASLSLGGIPSAMAASEETTSGGGKNKMPICFFTKPIDRYETSFMTDVIAEAGFDGIDLTVRPGGKVEPARVDNDLPKFAEAAKSRNLSLLLMTTSITGPESPLAEKVLKAASETGIKHYRLGYVDYDLKAGIWESLQKYKEKLRELAPINKRYQIQAGYHNHTGVRVGATVWDIWELVRGLPVDQISVQYDIRHAVCEGGMSWVLGMRLVRPSIGSLAVKDFTWDVSSGRAKVVSVPLGEGIVDFDAFFKLVKELDIKLPITVHAEYPLLSRDEQGFSTAEKQKAITAKLKKDADFVRNQLLKHQIG
jgi:L-ribulose-5-phosphate 3-epimerase